ncbi:ABC transporter ATP-binding protein [Nocardioides campestrisoli]|uniref:ABC transporter ATP-binding protein n=1 Tax=Nocardioides campestrisoli TaxID=2736757 RepID=UPI00163DA802|nr:ATP-binding cassette domain-containing protein [Nocardioides campestrisoli]
MLSAEGLWFRHRRQDPWVLAGVDLHVAPGEVAGLWGASGTGKSTLAALLAQHRRPERGVVRVDGATKPPRGRPRPVQLVLQHPERAMNPRWRVRDVLREARPDGDVLACVPDGPAGSLVEPHWLDRHPHEISGGELQRVNLARALLTEPAYVLADEISASLDSLTQALLWQHLLTQVRERGLGVLAISHDQPLLDRVADRVVTLDAAAAGSEEPAATSLREVT